MIIVINENNTNQIKLLPDGYYPELSGRKFQLKIGRYLFIVPSDFAKVKSKVVENYAENLKAQVSYVVNYHKFNSL